MAQPSDRKNMKSKKTMVFVILIAMLLCASVLLSGCTVIFGDKIPDGGGNTPDDGGNIPDDGGNTPDDGGNTPDDGGNTPDDGGNTPDGGENIPGDNTPAIWIDNVDYYITTNIFVKYYVLCSNTESTEGIKLLVWRTVPTDVFYSAGSETIAITDYVKETVNGREYFVFEYADYKYTDMPSYIYTRAVIGEMQSEVNKYSILARAYDVLGKVDPESKSDDTLLAERMQGTLDFGASMQDYLEIDLDRPIDGEWYSVKVEGGRLPDGFSEGLYVTGDRVTLTAEADGDSTFSHWECNGISVGTDTVIEVTVGESHTCYKAIYN